MSEEVVVLAGGTGGAKLARGMLDVVGPEHLTVIANVGDDIEIYGGYVSPDPDLITFWLADLIDERGWGLKDDTFAVMDGLRDLGEEIWFNLGDRDLAIAIRRADALRQGRTLTEAHADLHGSLHLKARVLPASDRPVRTRVLSDGHWWGLQEFMIRGRHLTRVDGVEFRGAASAGTTSQVLAAIQNATTIVIGPSNPVISIGPILAVPELRDALAQAKAPVVAVSPVVGGEVLKGPTAMFMAHAGHPTSGAGIAALYGGLLSGLVCDDEVESLPILRTDLMMRDAAGRRRLAAATLAFAQSLRAAPRQSSSPQAPRSH